MTGPNAEGPHRAFRIDINAEGDNWEAALRQLQWFTDEVTRHGLECNSAMGGPDAGGAVRIRVDPEMTHEKYFQLVDAYLEKEKAPHAPA